MNADMDLLTAAHQKDHVATRSVLTVTYADPFFTDHFSGPGRTISPVSVCVQLITRTE